MTTFHVVCHLSQVKSGSYTLLGLFGGKKTCRNLRVILESSQIHNFWTRFVLNKKKRVIPKFKAKKISQVFSFFAGKKKTKPLPPAIHQLWTFEYHSLARRPARVEMYLPWLRGRNPLGGKVEKRISKEPHMSSVFRHMLGYRHWPNKQGTSRKKMQIYIDVTSTLRLLASRLCLNFRGTVVVPSNLIPDFASRRSFMLLASNMCSLWMALEYNKNLFQLRVAVVGIYRILL